MKDALKYWRTIHAIVIGMGLLLIISGCGKNQGREVLANVLFLRGTVTLEGGNESMRHPQSLTTASNLAVGDRIETSPNAMAALSLIPGIFVEVGAGTQIAIEQLRVRKRGDAMVDAMRSRLATLHLNQGVIYASLPDVGSGQCELNVHTGIGTLVARRGALFSLRLTSRTARVVCVDGEVQWSSSRGQYTEEVPPGYFRDYHPGDVPNWNPKTALKPVTEDAGAQNDVAAALDVAAAFDQFALRVRNAPPLKSSIPIERRTSQPP